MRRICSWLGVLSFSLLVGCGGGGGDDATAVVPARAGSADIDAAGGSVDAVLEGGTLVTLTVPPGALTSKTSFRLDPQSAANGDLAAVQVTPAGLQFRTPAQLVVTLPAGSDPSNKLVSFGLGGVRVPIGAVDTTRTMAVDLPYLGVSGAVAAALAATTSDRRATIALTHQRPAAATETALVLFVQNGDLTSAVTLWHQLVATLASDGSRDNAIEVQEGFTVLLRLSLDQASQTIKDQVAVDITTWRNVDCTQLTTAISALNSFDFSSDINGYTRRATDVLVFGRLTQDLFTLATQIHFIAPAACPTLTGDISAPVRPSFPSYISAATAALGALSPVDDFDTLLNTRLRQLLDFTASLQAFGAVEDLAAQVQALAANQTVRLRAGAYTDCRVNHRQAKQQTLLIKEIGDPGFEPLSPYGRNDLVADIQYCGMLIHWEVLDAGDAVLQKGDAGGILPGVIVDTVPVTLSGSAKLVLSGPLSALNCPGIPPFPATPTDSARPGFGNAEQLTFAAGPASGATSSVGTLTPGNDSGYLEVSDLPFLVSQLDGRAHPNGDTGNGQLVVQRTGAVCNTDFPGFTQHSALVKFTLNFGSVAITTASLPDATVGTAYVAQLQSVGGTAPFTWSATGLPPGLGIDAQSGLIGGTPTTAGNFAVKVSVVSADGSSSHSTVFVAVVAPPIDLSGSWGLGINIDCGPVIGGQGLTSLGGTVTLAQSSGTLSGNFSGFKDTTGECFSQTSVNGTFSATVGTDGSGKPVLTNVSIVVSIIPSNPNCQDLVKVPGPVALVVIGRFLVAHADNAVLVQTQCGGSTKFTGFDMSK